MIGCKFLFAELKVLLAIVIKYSSEKVSIAESDDPFSVGRFPTQTMECTLLFTLASIILSRNACSADWEILFDGTLGLVTGE